MNNVTPKRGRYKQYVSNGNVKIPSTTLWRNNQNSPSSPNNTVRYNQISSPNILLPSEEALLDNSHEVPIFTHDCNVTTGTSQNNTSNQELLPIQIENQSNEIVNDLIEEISDGFDSYDESGGIEFYNAFNNKEISKEELAAAYLVAFFNGTITQSALKDFVSLSNITSEIKLPSSFDGLAKVLMNENRVYDYQKKWFCGVCLTTFEKLDDRFQRSCKKCNVKLNMSYYLNINQQIQKIFSEIEINELKTLTSSTANILTDITDGLLYKKILETGDGASFMKKGAFSFLLNTDGISICKKSKLTIWPWYLTCNELPISKRFAFNNLILAGLT
jgi:hypothetical protein